VICNIGLTFPETPQIAAAFKYIRDTGQLELLLRDFWGLSQGFYCLTLMTDAVERRFPLVERDIKRFENRWSVRPDLDVADDRQLQLYLPSHRPTRILLSSLNDWQCGREHGECRSKLLESASPLSCLLIISQHSSHAIASFTSSFHQRLHHVLPLTFPSHLRSLLASSLVSLSSLPPDQPFAAPSPHLNRLGIISRYSAMLSSIAHDEIESVVIEEAAKRLTERRLPIIRDRIKAGVARWLAAFFEGKWKTSLR
jgi:hypothetical protein